MLLLDGWSSVDVIAPWARLERDQDHARKEVTRRPGTSWAFQTLRFVIVRFGFSQVDVSVERRSPRWRPGRRLVEYMETALRAGDSGPGLQACSLHL